MSDGVAIIGIGCRFPGNANSAPELWKMLTEGKDAVSEVSPDRWSVEEFYHPSRGMIGKSATRWAGQIEDIDRFDCEFFGISPREAALMDPQQRMLLEVCWEAMEDAGEVPEVWKGRQIGVFVGGFALDYMLMQMGVKDLYGVESHTATGCMMTLLANRLSYCYGFTGPSMTIDTACSSSLVAIHQACTSLLSGESEVAIAGGVNAIVSPSLTVTESRAGMLSPTGRSRAFDASADGYTRGEGAGLVVLKRADRALADGDNIYALIRASASNHDGHSEGLTVPSGEAQMALMRRALKQAEITPDQVVYAEAHGTGTPVGDPIEARAIGEVLREGRKPGSECLMGSIKTNIGHTEAAAGVAGLIKTAMVLKNRQVPPHLHLKNVNPAIDLKNLCLRIPTEPVDLSQEGELYACVNSFGFGGANAHVILSSWEGEGSGKPENAGVGNGSAPGGKESYGSRWYLPLSAGDEQSLRAMARDMGEYLEEKDVADRLADVCATASLHRQHLKWRLCAHGNNASEIAKALVSFGNESSADPEGARVRYGESSDHDSPDLVFVYTGMGPQWHDMGRSLYEGDVVFSRALDEVLEVFEQLNVPLRKRWFDAESEHDMDETELAQPANFALQVALTKWLDHYGVRPDVCVGHSAGEPAAAWAAGVFSLEDAVRISWARSHLQQRTSGQGTMIAVGGLGESQVREMLSSGEYRDVSIAAVNSGQSMTLAGDAQSLDRLVHRLEGAGHFVRKLQVKVPYHSSYMDPLREPLMEELAGIVARPAHTPLYSTVTGDRIDGEALDAAYWWRNVREPVHFSAAVTQILHDCHSVEWIEVGPHPVLARSIRETVEAEAHVFERSLHSLHRQRDERASMADLLAGLFVRGRDLAWSSLNGRSGGRIGLPRRRWQDMRLWYETPSIARARTETPEQPLLARRVDSVLPTWEVDLLAPRLSWLEDHRVGGAQVLPGAAYVAMALHAAREIYPDTRVVSVSDVRFERALYWSSSERRSVHMSIDPDTQHFVVSSRLRDRDSRWERHCSGRLELARVSVRDKEPLLALKARIPGGKAGKGQEQCYADLRRLGLEYGPCFQGILEAWKSGGELLARLGVPASIQEQLDLYAFHPVLMDLCLQSIAAAIPGEDGEDRVYMPVALGQVHVLDVMKPAMWAYARVEERPDGTLDGNVTLYNDEGSVAAVIRGCRVKEIDSGSDAQVTPQRLYSVKWDAQPREGEQTPAQEPGTWILCGPDSELRKAVSHAFQRAGHAVNLVEGALLQGPTARGRMLALLNDAGASLRGVLDLQGSSATKDELDGLSTLVTGSLHVMQALGDHEVQSHGTQRPRLWLVTRGAHAVAGKPVTRPAAGALWGLGRVFGHAEQAGLWGGMIDLDEGASPVDDAAHIVAECLGRNEHDEIAWRDGVRHVARMTESNLSLEPEHAPVVAADGIYVITGGLGGLGLETAGWLVGRGARHLLLLGRSGLPPRERWQDTDLVAAQRQRIEAVRAMERMGAHIGIEAVDIADQDALQDRLSRYRQKVQLPIRGVIHSAGTTNNHLLDDIDDDQFFGVFAPKVIGAWNLHWAVQGEPLDFFVSYSSATVHVSSSGQGNYASANACLDALMAWRQGQGLPGLAIGWGPWRDAGLARDLNLVSFYVRRGLYPLTNQQGMSALGALLGYSGEQGMVLGASWKTIAQSSPYSRAAPLVRDLVRQEEERNPEGPRDEENAETLRQKLDGESDPDRWMSLLHEGLTDIVSDIMGLRAGTMNVDDAFTSRGMDSMMAIEIKTRIEMQLGVSVAVVDLLRGASARSLAERIASDLRTSAIGDDMDALAAVLNELGDEQIKDLLESIQERA